MTDETKNLPMIIHAVGYRLPFSEYDTVFIDLLSRETPRGSEGITDMIRARLG